MRVSRAGLLWSCLLMVATGLAAEVVERDFHRVFDVAAGDRLLLEHGDGDVTIEAWDQDRLDVKVRYRARFTRVGLGWDPDLEVDFSQTGSTVRVVGREGVRGGFGFFRYDVAEHLYTIRAPSYLILDLDGEDGDVEITDWQGEITLRSDDGDIELVDIRSPRTDLAVEDGDIFVDRLIGKLEVVTEDGDLRVSDCSVTEGRIRLEDGDATFTRCEGSARFELADGELALERFRPDEISVRTDDGDVDLDFLVGAAMDVEVRTADGDITVDLERGASVRISVDTRDGPIRLDLPGAVDVKQRRTSASGRLGAGDGRLRIHSGDGRVVVREGS